MDDAQRARVAAEAIRQAETRELLANRKWEVEAKDPAKSSHVLRGASIRFLDVEDGKAIDRPVDEVIAELMVDVAMWKRRALQHGCKVEGDHECG